MARVACEAATTTGLVLVAGEITTSAWIDMPAVVRKTIEQVGYINADYGFDYRTCGVVTSIGKQSPDIDLGVSRSVEVKSGTTMLTDDELEQIGAGDQGMMIGFACNETPEYMPLTISLAHKLTRQLSQVRRKSWNGTGPMAYLRPDGKSQVTVQYEYGRPVRVDTVVISTQHADYIDQEQIRLDVIEHIIKPIVPAHLLDSSTKYLVNPTGRFVTGGPVGDAGLTGRKIIVDTYGGVVRHGGGAFSGKDPTKVDRSAAYATRWVAKNVVAAGLASRCEVQVSYAIGMARPLAISLDTYTPLGVHLVGSLPLRSSEEVFRTVAASLGDRVRRMPDGETGPRADWIVWQYPVLSARPEFEIGPPVLGFYRPLPRLKLRPG